MFKVSALGYTARSSCLNLPMPKAALLTISLFVVIFTAVATLFYNNYILKPIPKSEINSAVNQAKLLYRQKKDSGEDIASGPCLSNSLMPGWVADVAHSPRLAIDDLLENQCAAYFEGRAQHFVELDLDGNLIRAK